MRCIGSGIAAGYPNRILAIPPNIPLRGTEFYMPRNLTMGWSLPKEKVRRTKTRAYLRGRLGRHKMGFVKRFPSLQSAIEAAQTVSG
jgi:hypothetical protein